MPKIVEDPAAAAAGAEAALAKTEATDPRKAEAAKAGSYDEQVAALAPKAANGPVPGTEKAPTDDKAAEAAKKKEEEAKLARIQAQWESSLGKFLGGKLFDLIKEHVSPKALEGYAKQGVEAIVGEVPGLAGELGRDKGESAALSKFVKALMPALEEQATKWVESEGGQKIYAAISDWVMDHPKTVAISAGVAAIAAAVGAVVADMDVPELKQTFKLGKGLEASAGIDLGKIQSLSVQAANAGLSYKSEGLNASISGEYKKGKDGKDDTYSATLEAGTKNEVAGGTLNTKGKATIDQDGVVKVEVDGGFKTKVKDTPLAVAAGVDTQTGEKAATNVDGSISFGEKGNATTAKGTYNVTDGSFTVNLDKTAMDGALKAGTEYSSDKDGVVTQGINGSYKASDRTTFTAKAGENKDGTGMEAGFDMKAPKGGGLSANAKVGTGIYSGLNAGVGYSKDGFKAQLDLAMKDEVSRVSGSAEYKNDKGLVASGSTKLNLSDSRMEELSLRFGYQSKDEFKTFLVDYKTKWQADNESYAHSFEVLLERSFGRIEARATAGIDFSALGVQSANAELLGGYKLNEDWRILGSVGYTGDMLDDNSAFKGSMQFGAGVQYKDIGIRAMYTPDTKAFGIGLTIPLGRRKK